MIAPFFVPRRRVGALRPYKFAKHLHEYGWESHVLCFDVKGEQLTKYEEQALVHTQVYRIALPFDRTTKQSKSDISKEKKGTTNGRTQKFIDWVEQQLPVDSWYPLLRFNQNKIEELIKKIQPDILWSTADPWSNLIIGKNLSAKFHIPWVADLRDPWTLCPVRYNSKSKHVKPIDQNLEREVMKEADCIVFTAENTSSLYKQHYPEYANKIELIHNAFEVESPNDVSGTQKINAEADINLLFFGKFRPSSPAYVLIKILEQIAEKNTDSLKGVKILHLGDLTEEESKQAERAGVKNIFKTISPVPYENAKFVLGNVEILISILNPARNLVIPSKFWDYLAAGTPIFAIGNNQEMKSILTETGTGVQFSFEEIEKAVNFLTDTIQKIRSQNKVKDFNPHQSEIQKYSAQSATEKLVTLFENLLKKSA